MTVMSATTKPKLTASAAGVHIYRIGDDRYSISQKRTRDWQLTKVNPYEDKIVIGFFRTKTLAKKRLDKIAEGIS